MVLEALHDIALVSGTMCAMKMQVWDCAGNECETWVDCLLDSAVCSMADLAVLCIIARCVVPGSPSSRKGSL